MAGLKKYEAGTTFDGSMRAGECFVLSGSFRIAFGAQVVQLAAGDVATLPEGGYRVVVPHESGAVYLMAWALPKLSAAFR
ncbi:hypothetical protein NVS55_38365 [Myxococcus stipitatus]|uniref:hypothetical protein n=1 Tax=Myxococcus stipitatus TaxID=83455 RepID=UPI0031453A2E